MSDQDATKAYVPNASSAGESPTLLLSNPAPAASGSRIIAVPGYDIVAELGRGGMGVVYKAKQVGLNRVVALKMLLAGSHAGTTDLARFRSEAEVIARLQHPHIVQVYEVGECNGLPFFSLEFCGGGNLAARLDATPWPPARAAELVETLARAVHAAHQAGVIHRDLKPSNILLLSDGTPKITDFGLAKKLDDSQGQTQTGAVVGTPSYMAPEQAAGRSKQVSPATDVYALGAILYELLAGRPPFQADTPLNTVLQVLERLPERLRAFNPAVNSALEAICLHALEKEPRDRYPTALALAEDLAAYRRGEAVLAEATSNLWLLRLLWRESRHTEVMMLWGRIWQWHAGIVFLLFAVTNLLAWLDIQRAEPYIVCWSVGLVAFNAPIWRYRLRSGPALTRLEWQISQVWVLFGAACFFTGALFRLMDIPVMKLLPVVVVLCAMAIGCISAILGGSFRVLALACAAMAFVFVLAPSVAPVLFGAMFGLGLYSTGKRYAQGKPPNQTLQPTAARRRKPHAARNQGGGPRRLSFIVRRMRTK